MKKITATMLAFFVLASLFGCSNKNGDDADNDGTDSVCTENGVTETTIVTETDSSSVSVELPDTSEVISSDEDAGISSYTESFVNGERSVTLMYPRYGDGKHDLFDINMRNYAIQMYNQSGMMPEDSAVYEVTLMDITYESDTLVSAVTAGHIINTTSVSDSYFSYTVNADPFTGKIYLSEEFINDLDKMKSMLAEGEFVQSYGVTGVLEEINAEDMTQSWRSDYGVFPDIFFREGMFGVIAELPHVLGGYAGFEVSLSAADDIINDTAKTLVEN